MAELEDDEPAAKHAKTHGGGAKTDTSRTRYTKNFAKGKILQIQMPVHAPEVDPEGVGGTCDVSLYIVDRQQVWIDYTNMDWAVRYLYVQNLLRGVPLVDPNDAGPGSPAPTVLDNSGSDESQGSAVSS